MPGQPGFLPASLDAVRPERVMKRCLAVLLLCGVSTVASAASGVRVLPQDSGVEVRLRGISAVDADVAWASGARGTVLRTLDGGGHWRRIVVPAAGELDFRDVEGFDAQTAVVLAIGPGEASRVYRTEDGGEHWQLALHNRDPRAFFDCMVFEGERGWMLGDPVEGRFQIHATDDGGRSWRLLPDGPQAVEGEAAFAASGTCIARAGTVLAVATGGTVSHLHVLHDGDGRWQVVDSGLPVGAGSRGAFSLAPLPSAEAFVAVGGDFSDERAPAVAARLEVSTATVLGHEFAEGVVRPEPMVQAAPKVTALPPTAGYRSGVACREVAGTVCVAVGPSGVEVWDGLGWTVAAKAGYDAVDIAGNVGWASGDDGRIVRIEID